MENLGINGFVPAKNGRNVPITSKRKHYLSLIRRVVKRRAIEPTGTIRVDETVFEIASYLKINIGSPDYETLRKDVRKHITNRKFSGSKPKKRERRTMANQKDVMIKNEIMEEPQPSEELEYQTSIVTVGDSLDNWTEVSGAKEVSEKPQLPDDWEDARMEDSGEKEVFEVGQKGEEIHRGYHNNSLEEEDLEDGWIEKGDNSKELEAQPPEEPGYRTYTLLVKDEHVERDCTKDVGADLQTTPQSSGRQASLDNHILTSSACCKRLLSMATKRKLTTKSYDEKYEIIKFVDRNQTMKRKDVAAKFNVKPNTLSDILKNKEKIIKAVESPCRAQKGNSKRRKIVSYDDVDAALLLWFRQKECQPDFCLDGDILYFKAKQFAEKFECDAPPMSWVEHFKRRHGISRFQKAGEAAGVNKEVEDWKEGSLKDILNRYSIANIYNCDETSIFWQMLPENSLGFADKTYHGSKQSKTRITALVCANMDGSDKLPLLVIGKCKRPCAFRNVRKLPVDYKTDKRAWMNSSLFMNWLQKLNGKMERQSRKIAMFLDKCVAHPNVKLNNIELVFLPLNTTSVTQPMDGGVIQNLKLHYRHIMASRRLAAAETDTPFKWDFLDAILSLKAAWDKVTPFTIANISLKVGFVAPILAVAGCDQGSGNPKRAPEDSYHGPVREIYRGFRNIWEQLTDLFDDVPSLDDYIAVDENAECHGELTDDEIVAKIKTAPKDDPEDRSVKDAGLTNPLRLKDVYNAVDTIRHYNLAHECSDEFGSFLDQYESFLMSQLEKRPKQTVINDYIPHTKNLVVRLTKRKSCDKT